MNHVPRLPAENVGCLCHLYILYVWVWLVYVLFVDTWSTCRQCLYKTVDVSNKCIYLISEYNLYSYTVTLESRVTIAFRKRWMHLSYVYALDMCVDLYRFCNTWTTACNLYRRPWMYKSLYKWIQNLLFINCV